MSSLRMLVGAATVITLSLGIAGCTSDATSQPSASPSASASTSGTPAPLTLRFGVYGDHAVVTSYEQIAAAYHIDHPNITIDVEHSADAATANAQLDQEFEQGTAPDVFLVDHDALPAYVAAKDVQPVDQLLEERDVDFGDDFQRVGLEAFGADSALQCMPNNLSPLVVFYNKDLLRFRKLVPPGKTPPEPGSVLSWTEFTTAAESMSRDDTKGLYIEPSLRSLIPLVRSAGADVLDDDQKPTTLTMSDDGTRTALEEILAVVRNPLLTPTRAELKSQDAISRFEQGKIGMMFGTRALVPELRNAPNLRFDVMPLPNLGMFHTVAEMTGLCISAKAENVPAAADFLAFAVGERGGGISAESGTIVPANLSALHSPEFIQSGLPPENADVFDDSVRRADPLPFVAGWPDLESQVRPLVERLLYAPVLNLDTLLTRMDQLSQPILSPASASPSS